MRSEDRRTQQFLTVVIVAIILAMMILLLIDKQRETYIPRKPEQERGDIRFIDESPVGRKDGDSYGF
ncbi:MAG: hypothetical protein NC924_02825 [Candidatus Omnitrophica bacterium]|nr:hypothetical protein [Candidatus Omnitrophota bacterium]